MCVCVCVSAQRKAESAVHNTNTDNHNTMKSDLKISKVKALGVLQVVQQPARRRD